MTDLDAEGIAIAAFYSLENEWDRGGDMGYQDGLVFKHKGRTYAVRLELWTEECLMALARRGPAQAKIRGQRLASEWQREGWPYTGYLAVTDNADIFGFTWAVDKARASEIATRRR